MYNTDLDYNKTCFFILSQSAAYSNKRRVWKKNVKIHLHEHKILTSDCSIDFYKRILKSIHSQANLSKTESEIFYYCVAYCNKKIWWLRLNKKVLSISEYFGKIGYIPSFLLSVFAIYTSLCTRNTTQQELEKYKKSTDTLKQEVSRLQYEKSVLLRKAISAPPKAIDTNKMFSEPKNMLHK